MAQAPADLVRSASAGAMARQQPRHLLRPAPPPPTGSTQSHQPRPHPKYAWQEDDSGPIPSDIELVRGGGGVSQDAVTPEEDGGGARQQRLTYYPEGHPYHDHRYPLSDYRPLVPPGAAAGIPPPGGAGSPRLFYSPVAGSAVAGATLSPTSPSAEDPSNKHSPTTPQSRSPRGDRRGHLSSQWSRSFQNPIGTVYHPPPPEDAFKWGPGGDGPPSAGGGAPPSNSGVDLPRQWSGSMLGPPDPGYYVPAAPTPPIYSSGAAAAAAAAAAASSYHPLWPRDKPPPSSTGGGGGGRPISADVGRLFSVQEDPIGLASGGGGVSPSGGPAAYSSQHRREEKFKKGKK